MSDPSPSHNRSAERTTIWTARLLVQFLYAIIIITEVVLIMGFLLLLFGANSQAGFVAWAYRNLERVMAPFRGIFEPVQIGTAGNDVPSVLDTSVLFAMVIYGIVLLALRALIEWLGGHINQIDRAERDEIEYQRQLERDERYARAVAMNQQALGDPTTPQPRYPER